MEQDEQGTVELAPGMYVIFDGPPGPESGRFVELNNEAGTSLGPDESGAAWCPYADGLWSLGPFGPAREVTGAEEHLLAALGQLRARQTTSGNRHQELAITKLEEALLWLGQDARQL